MSAGVFRKLAILLGVWIVFSRLYILLRYGPYWTEWDTGFLAMTIKHSLAANSLTPTYFQYPNGDGYQALSVILIRITGLSVSQYQVILSPVLAILPFPAAYIFFREFTGSREWALESTAILSLFPYFTAITVSGSHDKFTYALIAIYFLSLNRVYSRPKAATRYAALALLSLWATSFYNVFIGTTLAVALAVAVLASTVLFRGSLREGRVLRRQVTNSLMGLTAVTVTVFWLYPPALNALLFAKNVLDILSTLLFGGGRSSTYLIYNYVNFAYSNQQTYYLLSAFTWAALGLSGAGWILALRDHIRGRPAPVPKSWITFYAAFSVIFLVAAIADYAGGSDFQLRAYGMLLLFAPPLTVLALSRIRHRVPNAPSGNVWTKRGLTASVAAILCLAAAASMIQSTNDPSISNNWFFYSPGEQAALGWLDSHPLSGNIEAGYGNRLISAYYLTTSDTSGPGLPLVRSGEIDYLLWSTTTSTITSRTHTGVSWLSDFGDEIYDNGAAWVLYNATGGAAR